MAFRLRHAATSKDPRLTCSFLAEWSNQRLTSTALTSPSPTVMDACSGSLTRQPVLASTDSWSTSTRSTGR